MARPRKITEDVLRKLEIGFAKGLSDRECCLYAGIGESTLYDYCRAKPQFSERKEMLKDNLKMRSKINVAEKIEGGDLELSLWYLERKCKNEFSTKQEVGVSGDISVNNPFKELTTDELKKMIEDG